MEMGSIEAGARTAVGSHRQAGGSVVPEHTCSDNTHVHAYADPTQVHIVFCVYVVVSSSILFVGKTLIGIFPAISLIGDIVIVGTNETNIKSKSLPIIFDLLIFYFIGFALFWLEAFLSMWVIQVLEGGAVVRTLRDHSIPSNGDINESKVSYLLLLYSCWCNLKMKSQLLKAEMKSLMKEQRQKVQYIYYRDYEGDQRL
ncbi:Secretory carrier-associated membrane protein 4 [Zea mays]|uniref:Secretory carrier-associated membrane protein 4 n=1 Tax=Zea mays TaxID=4577 RepID=A0A3L6E6G8_MAIZE|nr:Secretory carrier-associated membrane protein 4 [Zea mays]